MNLKKDVSDNVQVIANEAVSKTTESISSQVKDEVPVDSGAGAGQVEQVTEQAQKVSSVLADAGQQGASAGAAQKAVSEAGALGGRAIKAALEQSDSSQAFEPAKSRLSEQDQLAQSPQTSSKGGGIAQKVATVVSSFMQGGEPKKVELSFETSLRGDANWSIVDAELEESICQPYELVLNLKTSDTTAEPSRLLMESCEFFFERDNVRRRITGIIREVDEQSGRAKEKISVSAKIRVVPVLWTLSQRKNTRIFQDKTAHQIIEEVLKQSLEPYGREFQIEVDRNLPVREYTLQYDETDLDFIHRLMEQEGLFYWFNHDETDHEKIIIVDDKRHHQDVELNTGTYVPYLPSMSGLSGREYLRSFDINSKIRPTKVSLNYHDWTRVDLEIKAESQPEQSEQSSDDIPNGAEVGQEREVYEHDEPIPISEYSDDGSPGKYNQIHVEDQVRLRRELQAKKARVARGTGTVVGMIPGRMFELSGHDCSEHDGHYLVLEVKHKFTPSGNEGYDNEITCIPGKASFTFRPDRKTAKPRISGIQTARVVGPNGEEIYTDGHGRIKVQFEWDRVGERNERSSCWLRVMQPWAGSGWGCSFIPRINMEVVVSFINGDPDRPIVTGCVYNGENLVPLDLSKDGESEKTRSTIKTQSTPGGDGYNELTFDDKAGEEQIIVHAQKDYNETIENNHSTTIHGNRTNSIDGSQSGSVGGDQSLSITGNRNKTVEKEETITVAQKRETTINGLEKGMFTASREFVITGTDSHVVSDKLTENFAGGRATVITNHDSLVVTGGNRTTNVGGGQYLVDSTAQLKLAQGGANYLNLDNCATLETSGEVTVTNNATTIQGNPGGKLTLSANAEVKLECGAGSITIKPDGTIEIKGTTVVVNGGAGKVEVAAAGVSATGGKIDLTGGMVNVAGGLVKIN